MAARIIEGPQSQLDTTVRIYDAFYNFDLIVEANQYELVYSYFYNISYSEDVANNFTAILFRISNFTQTNVLDLLDELKRTTSFKASNLLTLYLNSFKSKTTLYGISNVPQPNQLVQRNILV
jgi:hypothetical protein